MSKTRETQHALSVSEALRKRRAIKAFDPNHRMGQHEFTRIMEHVLLSPTAFNIQHWRFVRVEDPALRQAIRAAALNQAQVTDASLLLVLCFDCEAWRKDPQRYWRDAPPDVQAALLPAIAHYYQDREQAQRDEGMRSCGLAAMSAMLMAQEMGYDSCPMDGFDFDRVAELIRLPPDHEICMMIAIGKQAMAPWPRSGQLSMDEVLVHDRFS